MNLLRNWASGSGGDVVQKISYLELLRSSCSVEHSFEGI